MSVHSLINIKSANGNRLSGYEKHLKRENNNYKNLEINLDKTSENVVLIDCKETFDSKIKNVIKEYDIKINKKTTTLIEGLIKLNPDNEKELETWNKDDYIQYFKNHLEEFEKEYKGKTIYATIHFDETHPHLHFSWMPLVLDKNIEKTESQLRKDRQKMAMEYAKRNIIKEYHLEKNDKNLMNLGEIKKLQLNKYSGDKLVGDYLKINNDLAKRYIEKLEDYIKNNKGNSKKGNVTISKTKLGLGGAEDIRKLQDFHFEKSKEILEKMNKKINLVRRKNNPNIKYIENIETFKEIEKNKKLDNLIKTEIRKEEKLPATPNLQKNLLGNYKTEDVENLKNQFLNLKQELNIEKKKNIYKTSLLVKKNLEIEELSNKLIKEEEKLEQKLFFTSFLEIKQLKEKEEMNKIKEQQLLEKENQIENEINNAVIKIIENEENLEKKLFEISTNQIRQINDRIRTFFSDLIEYLLNDWKDDFEDIKLEIEPIKNDIGIIEKVMDFFAKKINKIDLIKFIKKRWELIKKPKVKVLVLEKERVL